MPFDNIDKKGRIIKYLPEHRVLARSRKRIENKEIPKTKVCPSCEEEKDSSCFGQSKPKLKTGLESIRLRSWCKDCESRYGKGKTTISGLPKNEWKKEYRKKAGSDIRRHVQERIHGWKAKQGPESDLTVDYLVSLWDSQSGLCYYSGVPLVVGRKAGRAFKDSASLDRMDPNKGYVKGNVAWCSYLTNTMKQDLDVEAFLALMNTIISRLGEQQ